MTGSKLDLERNCSDTANPLRPYSRRMDRDGRFWVGAVAAAAALAIYVLPGARSQARSVRFFNRNAFQAFRVAASYVPWDILISILYRSIQGDYPSSQLERCSLNG